MGSAWSSTLSNLFISYCLGSPIFIFHYCIGDELCDRFGDRGAKEPEPDEKMFFYHIKHTHTRDADRENLAGSKEKQNLQFKYTENPFRHLTPKPSFFQRTKDVGCGETAQRFEGMRGRVAKDEVAQGPA